jgi:Lipoprotein LpqB beta-propeller domain
MTRFGRRAHAGWLAGLMLSAVLVLAACGVPSSSDVVVDGAIASNGAGADAAGPPPPGPDDPSLTDAESFVTAYLNALGGAPTDDAQLAAARSFMTPATAAAFRPNGTVYVVRTPTLSPDTEATGEKFDVTAQVVGTFSIDTGILSPAVRNLALHFEVGDNVGGGVGRFRLTAAPPELIMTESALVNDFDARSVYFWDASRHALISDVRYVPGVASPTVQATLIVRWVLAGPSYLISQAAAPLVATHLNDPTVTPIKGGHGWVVNLDSGATALEHDQLPLLAYQLRWSLTPSDGTEPPAIEIEINGQPQLTSSNDDYRMKVANLSPSRVGGPEALGAGDASASRPAATFAINGAANGGKVVAIAVDGSAGVTTEVTSGPSASLLGSGSNSNVVHAAVNGSSTAAALVRRTGSSETLWVRRTNSNSNPDFTEIKYRNRPLTGSISRPQFLGDPFNALVVAVNGQLYEVDTGYKIVPIDLPATIPSVTAFAIAADSHRIAFVSGGRLWLSVLSSAGPPTMSPAIQIVPADFTRINAVSWLSPYELAVAGDASGTAQVTSINIDGSASPSLKPARLGALTISDVSSYSYDPLQTRYVYFDVVLLQTSQGAFSDSRPPQPLQLTPTPGHKVPLTSPFFQD